MKIFKTERNKYLLNELISWGWNIIIVGIISMVIFYTTNIKLEDIYVSILCLFLLKFSDTVQQEKITTIKVDAVNNTLDFILSSRLSGKEEKSVPLNLAKARLVKKPAFSIWLYQKCILKLMLPDNIVFTINQRYGFSENALIEIEEAINHGLNPNVNTNQLHTFII